MTMFDLRGTRQNMEVWLKQMLYMSADSAADCFVLKHVSEGGKADIVCPFNVAEVPRETSDIHLNVMNNIMEAAQADAEGFGGGTQKYAISALRGREVKGRFTFRVEGPDDDMDDGVTSRDAEGTKGHYAQMMRHEEVMFRNCMGAVTTVMSLCSRIMRNIGDQNEVLSESYMDTLNGVRNMARNEREFEVMASESRTKQELMRGLYEKLSILFPVVVNKVSGREIVPTTTTSTMEALRSILEALKPEQVEAILYLLDPVQKSAFISVYQSMRKEEDEKQKKLPPGNGRPRA